LTSRGTLQSIRRAFGDFHYGQSWPPPGFYPA
jgi:hypothetical protein